MRKTRQRQALQQIFHEARHPLEPLEALQAVQRYVPGLSRATLYRALKVFLAEGMLVPVRLPGDQVRYEMAGKQPHPHFYCRICARVFDTWGCVHNLQRLIPAGFSLEYYEVILYGICAACNRR